MDATTTMLLGWLRPLGAFLLLWAVASIPATIVWFFLQRLLPGGGSATAARILAAIPPRGALLATLLGRIDTAHATIVDVASGRLILDARHDRLTKLLKVERDKLDTRLRGIENSAVAGGGGELHKLLLDFRGDVEQAPRFYNIPHDLVDQSVILETAKKESFFFLVATLLVSILNVALLWQFFDEKLGGEQFTIWSRRIPIGACVACFAPLLEYGCGKGIQYFNESDERGVSRICRGLAIILACIEYFIFFQLFSTSESVGNVSINGFMVDSAIFLSALGPVITLVLVGFSYAHAKSSHQARVARALVNMKKQLDACNRFVDGLPTRLRSIEQEAAGATRSIDTFRTALEGRGALGEQIGTTITDHRVLLVAELDRVNPSKWANEPNGLGGDASDAGRFAWGLALLFPLVLAAFARLGGGLFAGWSGLGEWSYVLAAAIGVGGFVAGTGVFNRVGVARASGAERVDVINARADSIRIASTALAASVVVVLVWAGWRAGGWSGVGIALGTSVVFAVLVLLGSLATHVFRGFAFLGQAAMFVAIFVANALGWLVRAAAHAVAAVLAWVVPAIVELVALLPTLLIWRWWAARRVREGRAVLVAA